MPPSSLPVRLSDEALEQITMVSEYIAAHSPEHAARWRSGIRAKIKSLSQFPARNAVIYTPQQARGREVRETYFGVYRILYCIETTEIVVLTVRHGARKPIGPAEVEGIE